MQFSCTWNCARLLKALLKIMLFSVKKGKRLHVQKRLVLSHLREVYRGFKEKFPDQKIGFSKFAEIRPKHCILAGASGRYVCAPYIKM